MVTLPEMPESIAKLPRDDRGYPVPWFVVWIDGKPEFRVADARKWRLAVLKKLCWVCGEPLDPQQHVFVIGPMCAVNHTTAEPPVHVACAEFSAQACPFLSMPKAQRREAKMPDGTSQGPGMMIRRNPGVSLHWYCRGFTLKPDGRGGQLIHLPNPSMVRWWSEGRKATRDEILESIETGLQFLEPLAAAEGKVALIEFKNAVKRAMKLVPAA